jgi:Gamma-glutamyl cyclotransferase, AIG2-like
MNSNVFFYGLFMDVELLKGKGITALEPRSALLRDWVLRIGNRATLVPTQGGSVYGMLMSLPLPSLDRLYADPSVQMYRPVAVLVEPDASAAVPALAYILSEAPAPDEANAEYAAKLRALAERLGFPREYTSSIS